MPTVLLSLIVSATMTPFELTTLDEQSVRGELIGLSADTVALRSDEGDVMIDVDQVLSLTPVTSNSPTAPAGEIMIEFADGSTTPAVGFQVASGEATITLGDEDQLKTPARRIRCVRFLKQAEHEKSLWNDIVASNPKGDAVVVRKGGEGKPVTLDFLEGALRDVSDERVQFEFEGDVIPVNRAKVRVEGLLYYQRDGQDSPAAACRVDDATGGQWMATSVRLDGESIAFSTPGGVQRTLPLAAVKNLDYSLGKIAFLSDLAPVKKAWRPYLGSASVSDSARRLFDVRRDQDFGGSKITLGDRKFRKGLAMHSRTEISYRLPGEFSRLQAVVGIDPSQKNHGHVRLEIRGDNRVLLDKPIAGDASPETLELDISGVGRLTVLVDFGENWDIGDQLLLGGARVIK